MVKNKTICLDEDIILLLSKEENSSKLINTLLRNHYDQNDISKWSRDKILLEIEKKKLEEEYKNKIKTIEIINANNLEALKNGNTNN